jgi:nucleotide-binding universal stress UspA family protein
MVDAGILPRIYRRVMSTPAAAAPGSDPFQAVDDSKISKFQLKIMFVSGMGFFTDAYDLFVIGIVVALIETQWKLSTHQVSWPHSEAALRWALADAKQHEGQVVAVFAWQVPFSSFPGLYDREALEKAAKEFLIERVSAVAPAPAVPLLPLVAEGDPAEALITAAKDADLLVLGTRGRSPVAGLLLGSVSQLCAAAAACPVVLIKKQDIAES